MVRDVDILDDMGWVKEDNSGKPLPTDDDEEVFLPDDVWIN